MKKAFLVILAAAITLSAGLLVFGRSVDIKKLHGPYTVSERGQEPKLAIPVGSDEEQRIIQWLNDHNNGWSISFTTFAPTLSLRGSDFHLNITGSKCVLNYRGHFRNAWTQVVRDLTDDEKNELRELLGVK